MAILVDYSQFVIAAIFNSMKEGLSASDVVDENVVRHLLLNHLRVNRKKFHQEYGELVICCDSKNSWRRDFFPYYKVRRIENKKKSDLDWTRLHEVMMKLKEELKEHFPYKVIEVDKCEGDDIIGTICHTYGDEFLAGEHKILILSVDKDFKQLLKFRNVKQYNQHENKFMHVDDPEDFLTEMIIKGDSGDDIPNMMSPNNVFALKIRQKPITKKRLEEFKTQPISNDFIDYWKRNKVLIDLYCTPTKYKERILEEYAKETPNKRGKLMDYFFKKGLSNLLSDIGDF